MKKLLLFCIFITVVMNVNAQTEETICATPDNPNPNPTGVYSKSIDTNVLNDFVPVVYNIFFWGINDDNGNGENQVVEKDVLDAIARINIAFNDANIFFKYKGFDHINSSVFDTIVDIENAPNTFVELLDFAENEGYKKENSFNMYVPQYAEGFSGIAGPHYTNSAVRYEAFSKPLPIHELGHCFNLLHPFHDYDNENGNCEHVTRDTENSEYNAHEAGDWVRDTAAQDEMWDDVDPDCFYTGNGQDCEEPPVDYAIPDEDVKNFMGYGGLRLCGDRFTTGQNIRMREAINDDVFGSFVEAETTIASLYEPYKGSYPEANNTYYASIPDYPPLFQPGFDYKFLNCYPDGGYPQPSDYYDTSFSYIEGGMWWYGFNKNIDPQHYSSIFHRNGYAIRIEQLQLQPRKCWNNGIASGGTIIKFNDGILNTNVTITAQDSASINNEELINDLQPGLYNVIKDYQDGRTEETVILKENN